MLGRRAHKMLMMVRRSAHPHGFQEAAVQNEAADGAAQRLFASVTLGWNCTRTTRTHDSPLGVVPALWRSVSTLTALHGLCLVELCDSTAMGLALAPTFSRLRELTLHQTVGSPRVLPAALLPTSLQELTLESVGSWVHTQLPPRAPVLLVAFERLHQLRRMTFCDYALFALGSWHNEDGRPGPVQLPTGLEVCIWSCTIPMHSVYCSLLCR